MNERARLIRQANFVSETTARKFCSLLGNALSLDDLRGFAGEAVARALAEWDGRGDFTLFALQRARWAVLDGLRRLARQQGRSDRRDEILATAVFVGAAEVATQEDRDEPSLVAKLLQEAASGFDLELASAPDNGPGEERVELDVERMRVRRAVEALPEPARQVIEGHYYLGQTFKEIAEAMGTSRSTVFDIHKRAVRTLWQMFSPKEQEAA